MLQVLSSVKHKVDCFAYSVNDFDKLMAKARNFLAWREGAISDPRGMGQNTPPPSVAAEAHPNKGNVWCTGSYSLFLLFYPSLVYLLCSRLLCDICY